MQIKKQGRSMLARKVFNLDLRHYITNLTPEIASCSPATPPHISADAPIPSPIRPGQMSNWCGTTFFAKLWFATN